MSKLINNPHDKTFKKVLSDTKLAKRFFEQHLPFGMQKKVKLETLQLQKGSFVDDNLSEHLTDLLYSVDIADRDGYIYLLLEHQSTTDELMAFRLLKYMVNIMQHHLNTKKTKKLPLVLPVVYYVGNSPSGKFVPDIMDCFENPALARHYFLQPFTLVDLQKMSDDELMKDKALAGLELLQKHVKDRDLSTLVYKMIKEGIFLEMRHESGEYFNIMLKYVINTGNLDNAKDFLETLANQIPEEKMNIMTIAEQLRNEGMQQRERELILNLLRSGKLDDNEIVTVTGVNKVTVEELKSQLH